MINLSLCVPFRIPGVYGGWAEIQGLLRSEADSLVLDFEVKESVLDLLRLHSKVSTIALEDLAAVEWRHGWFRRWIVLRVKRLEALRQLPGAQTGELRLKIARQHAKAAEEFVGSVQMAMIAYSTKKMLEA